MSNVEARLRLLENSLSTTDVAFRDLVTAHGYLRERVEELEAAGKQPRGDGRLPDRLVAELDKLERRAITARTSAGLVPAFADFLCALAEVYPGGREQITAAWRAVLYVPATEQPPHVPL